MGRTLMFCVFQCVEIWRSLTFDTFDTFDTYDTVEIHFQKQIYLTNNAHTRKNTGTLMQNKTQKDEE